MTTSLRLVLGVGRSGTTWLASLLGRTPTPIRFLMEGMYPFVPRMNAAPEPDHTAAPWVAAMGADHPIRSFYAQVLAPDFDPALHQVDRHTVRNDPQPAFTLVKEVHGLLVTEALVTGTDCKVCFIHRNPVYSADSLFHRDGIGSIYLINEWRHVQDPAFIARYFPGQAEALRVAFAQMAAVKDDRRRVILRKVMTITMINLMMKQIADGSEKCIAVDYEDMCFDPSRWLRLIMDFMGFAWGEEVDRFVAETSDPAAQGQSTSSHYPIFRDSRQNSTRPLRFIDEADLAHIRSIIDPVFPGSV